MASDEGNFLARWSRLKRAEAAKSPAKQAPAPDAGGKAVDLPPLDQLTPDSDFTQFMGAKVKDGVRRAALKKLFADPRFNVIDVMDVYIDDYTNGETISPEMLADLEHSKTTLHGRRQEPAPDENVEPGPETPLESEPAPLAEAAPPDASVQETVQEKKDGAAG